MRNKEGENMLDSKGLFRIILFILIIGLMTGCGQKSADLVITNGKIVTMDDSNPEAQAVAISGDKILAVGSDEEIQSYVKASTEVIDLDGMLAVPGLIESHGHFTSLGRSKMHLNLMKTKNWDEIVAMVNDAAEKTPAGEWIQGRGWHQEKWDKTPRPNVDGLPYHHSLSEVSPDNPVFLDHASGHSAFVNAKALELAGITKDTPNPPGGEIVKDRQGNPIGVLRETAQRLVNRVMSHSQETRSPEQIDMEMRTIVDLATQECLSKGITSFHDAGAPFSTIDFYRKLVDGGKLGIRLNVMIGERNEQLEENLSDYMIIGYGDNRLTVRTIKRLIDGALGAHGAWLLEPYNSLPTSVGLNTEAIDVMKETARLAIENGFQLATHAIGDRGNRETLDIYQEAFEAHPDKKDLRWRIEHSQHLHPYDILRFGAMGVIASMQAIHCTSDGPWVIKRLGEKRAEEGAYVWQKLMNSGAIICNGTDVPVEDVDPIACYYASVTRKLKDGTVFYPDQCMTREEALRSYTMNGAYAAFEEDIKGSLEPGKLADITVLSKDIMTIPDDEILTTEVVYTIVGGKMMYTK